MQEEARRVLELKSKALASNGGSSTVVVASAVEVEKVRIAD